MKDNGWVVVAKVGEFVAAKRTDSCGDMEQLELMELILVSEHETKVAAEQAAKAKRVKQGRMAVRCHLASRLRGQSRLSYPAGPGQRAKCHCAKRTGCALFEIS